jgi:hypothetical protein
MKRSFVDRGESKGEIEREADMSHLRFLREYTRSINFPYFGT